MNLLHKIFPPFVLFLIPFACIFILIQWRIVREWYEGKHIQGKWIVYLCLVTAIVRTPSTLVNRVTNIDEAQTIAHALTLFRSPIPWVGLDFTTNGPLNAYIFFIPHIFGLPANYLTSHIILIALQIVLTWTIYITLRNWFGINTARVSLLPLFIFLSFAQCPDFLHHSSETWSVVAFSSALAVFSGISKHPERSRVGHWLAVGILLGIVPFGKPQGAPPAVMAALFIALYIFLTLLDRKLKLRFLSALILGGLLFPSMVIGIVIISGGWNEFLNLYIHANLRYADQHGPGLSIVPTFLWKWSLAYTINLYFFILILFLITSLFVRQTTDRFQQLLGIFLGIIVYSSAFAVEKAGRPFGHYLIVFLFPGLLLLFGWTFNRLSKIPKAKWLINGSLAALIGVSLVWGEMGGYYRWFSAQFPRIETIWQTQPTRLANYVKSIANQPGDCITSYGYYTELYVDTQLPSATRTVTIYQHTRIWPKLYAPYYYADLKKNRPVVFVDALDIPNDARQTAFANRATQDPKFYPELRDYLKANYSFVKEIDKGKVYIRKDRL